MLFISLVCLLYDKNNAAAYQRLYRKVAWQLKANVFHHLSASIVYYEQMDLLAAAVLSGLVGVL